MSRLCQCFICDKEEVTNKTVLPDGWAVLWEYPRVICDTCLAEYERRYEQKPILWIQGGEKELTLFDLEEEV